MDCSNLMKAAIVESPEKMKIDSVPRVSLRSDSDVIIKVKAAGVNRADVLQRKGSYGGSGPIGLEIAGIVEEVGASVTKFAKGDSVMALVDGGGYAEYCVAFESQVMLLPSNYSFEQGASIPEAFLTAFQNIFVIGKLKENEKILVHAGASGVGIASIQLCKMLNNVDIFVTVGTSEKAKYCESLGVTAINYKESDWYKSVVEKATSVDVVFDCIGQDYFQKNINVLKLEGRLLMIGSLSGWVTKEGIDLQPIVRNRIRIEGSTLKARSTEYKAMLVEEFLKFTSIEGRWDKIQPTIAKVFDWNDVNDAHKYMEENQNIGKIILTGM